MADDGYEVKRGIIGKPKVAYKCAKCHNDLESDLTDAGKKDTCPFCKAAFIVPGQRELNEIQDAAKQAAAEENAKRDQQEQENYERRMQREEEKKARRRKEEEEHIRQREERLRLEEAARIRRVNMWATVKGLASLKPFVPPTVPPQAEPSEVITVLLGLLFVFGFVWTFYFFWGYETSVPRSLEDEIPALSVSSEQLNTGAIDDDELAAREKTPSHKLLRIHNQGRLAHQHQGVIIGIGLMVVCAILIAERRIRGAIIRTAREKK